MTVMLLQPQTIARFRRKRLTAMAVPVVIIAYFTYIFVAFDMAGLADRVSVENARTLVSDIYSYKTHVARDNRTGDVIVSIEGERKGEYPQGSAPDWVTLGDDTVIDLGAGHVVTFGAQVTYDVPGYGRIVTTPGSSGVNAVLPAGDLPDWISASKNRISVTTDAGRVTVTRNRAEVFRYALGWELFFFTLDSPYYGLSLGEVTSRAFTGEAGAIWDAFWSNKMWRHGDVAWALVETILMAFLGTFGAAIVALPLGFLAAKNFTPLGSLRFVARRLFDFLRGVDGLIWTIVLSRAYGPGPLTGALAILLTDTGSFGKMFSEALENVDDKQIEGITSTGAKPLQRYRFGVIPQITPILLSQVLYYLESNTRSATIIGAITGGGIGLLLTQAIITQKDWEEVTYYIVLIIVMVMMMDTFSGWLRRKLIKGKEGGH
ncbi:phosphonate ABC transporter, permease protein PhnE [Yoonia sp.]|uniref:phosphonate ABC transporter, permease protein PhnE n=1 Tax=Yoonia sp. TaxID=2212373 RepID=UPI0025F4ED19|nr:phosphonate ABC transporter, permease protein PhnE [Yoonia sp.]